MAPGRPLADVIATPRPRGQHSGGQACAATMASASAPPPRRRLQKPVQGPNRDHNSSNTSNPWPETWASAHPFSQVDAYFGATRVPGGQGGRGLKSRRPDFAGFWPPARTRGFRRRPPAPTQTGHRPAAGYWRILEIVAFDCDAQEFSLPPILIDLAEPSRGANDRIDQEEFTRRLFDVVTGAMATAER